MVKCRIRRGDQEMKFEAEVPISMSVSDAEIEFERTVRLAMEGEGKVTVDLPATVYASRLLLEGSATVRTEEGVSFAPKAKAPRHGVQAKVMEKLDEADCTPQELADALNLGLRQVQNAANTLRRKGLVTRIGDKLHKVGVQRRDPREARAPGAQVVG